MYIKKFIFGQKQVYKEGNKIVFKKYPSLCERIFGKRTALPQGNQSKEERLTNLKEKLLTSMLENSNTKERVVALLNENMEKFVNKIPYRARERIVRSGLEEKVLKSIWENLIDTFLDSLVKRILLGSAIGAGVTTPALANSYTNSQVLSLLNDPTIVESANDFVDVSFGNDSDDDVDISNIDLVDDIIPMDSLLDSVVTSPDSYSSMDDIMGDIVDSFNSVDYSGFDIPDVSDEFGDLIGEIGDLLSSLFGGSS